jgi:RNA polymerase sigma factor (sigma-70 family)
MQLTPEQQRLAEQAMEIVPKAIIAFRCRYPTLRKQVATIDATSVAYLAICRAAVTYDPEQSKITTYFSMAIRNALLKEIDRNRRMRYDSAERVPMELAEALAVSKQHGFSTRIQTAIARLPAKSRKLIHMRFFRGLSLREMGEQSGCDPRTIQRRLAVALECLGTLLQSEPLVP